MEPQVLKRDGSLEPFTPAKVNRVLMAAGMDTQKANIITQAVSAWVKSSQFSQISSLQIRDRVVEELEKSDPRIANIFVWFEKTKEKTKLT